MRTKSVEIETREVSIFKARKIDFFVMAASAAICNHSGCYCKEYVVSTSKWSKGKCKKCNHSQKEHAEINADVTFDSDKAAAAPQQNNCKYQGQIDGKMGIVPSGATNFKDTGYGQQNQPKQEKSIYSVCIYIYYPRTLSHDIYIDRYHWMNQIGSIGAWMIYLYGFNKKGNFHQK